MKIGAVIVAAGLESTAMVPAGKISVAQRMVAVFRKIGIDLIVVVSAQENRPLEKQLSQFGVLFLHNRDYADKEISAKAGLEYLCDKCDRIFFLDTDRPLLSPESLKDMLGQNGELVVPVYEEKTGRPLLFSGEGAKKAVGQAKPVIDKVYFPVEDDGVLLSAAEAQNMDARFKAHDSMITGISLDFGIHCGRQLLDRKLISLLYLIKETQSVREACERMKISYSSAWNMLNYAESELGYVLVLRNKGGASGSGSVLTEKGGKLLSAYLEFEAKARSNAETLYAQIFDGLI